MDIKTMSKEEIFELAKERIGQYILWSNGLKLFVIGTSKVYPQEFMICAAKNKFKIWGATAISIAKATVITEEEAMLETMTVRQNAPQHAYCSCCNWRVGKPNIEISINMKNGRLESVDEKNAYEEMTEFLRRHSLEMKLSSTPEGMKMLLVSFLGDLTKKED